jgi:hypothetical protein
MKAKQMLTAMIMLLFLQVLHVEAQSLKVKNYKMTVKGTSTLHDWVSNVEKLECRTSCLIEGNKLVDIKDVLITIPVESIKSEKGRIMDNKTYDAFNYEKYPSIVFTLSNEKINVATLTAELNGSLVMAGTSRPIKLMTNYKILSNGDLQITGAKKIKMTEFNMEPPVAMMGTIKVGDEVTISFDIILSNTNTTL